MINHVLKFLLPPIILSGVRLIAKKSQDHSYLRGGKVPWSPGYYDYKLQLSASVLKDGDLLVAFREDASLPPEFGIGMDEGYIEYPLQLAHLNNRTEVVLDADTVVKKFQDKHTARFFFQREVVHFFEESGFKFQGMFRYFDFDVSADAEDWYIMVVAQAL